MPLASATSTVAAPRSPGMHSATKSSTEPIGEGTTAASGGW